MKDVISIAPVNLTPKDLQPVLEPWIGFEITGCSSKNLLPPGDNFACVLLDLKIRFSRSLILNNNNNNNEDDKKCLKKSLQQEKDEEMCLVAKLFPDTEEMRSIFDFGRLFEKEIFFYERFLPVLQQLQRDLGIDDVLDIAPKFYGARRSLEQNKNQVDDGVILLMENLKTDGYYTLDKIQGLDLEHSRLTIKTLARLQALCIACKRHRPDFFIREVLQQAKPVPYQDRPGQTDVITTMFSMMVKDPRIVEKLPRLAPLLDPSKKDLFFNYVAEEPWLSIVHFDFWTNNILFRKDIRGKVDSVKFIDFQNYVYNSPMRDLPYFLCTSTNEDVVEGHLDELLDLYYNTFVEELKRMKCDVELFTRQSFDTQLKIDAALEFFHAIIAVKFFYAKIDKETYDSSQLDDVVVYSEMSQEGFDKWNQIIQVYIERGWL
ncbi:hypothetical protein QAD02_011585 [Eretmocerus hayati]|uniref:Uncharacterized protein n=1 Tax=Eretmocerus hayati TaxID=131215 RepID=A0ACC2NZU2_9HYME|nr:hypothetical protein QAD02_011585 [Eretmocerus hayati]